MAAHTILAHRRAVASEQMKQDMTAVGEALGVQLPEEPKGRFPDANHEYTARTEWLASLLAQIRQKVAPRVEPITPHQMLVGAQRQDQDQPHTGTAEAKVERDPADYPPRESGIEGRRVPPVAGTGWAQSQEQGQQEPTEVVDDADFEAMAKAEQGEEPMFVNKPLSYFVGKTDEEIKTTPGVGKRTFKAIKEALGNQ